MTGIYSSAVSTLQEFGNIFLTAGITSKGKRRPGGNNTNPDIKPPNLPKIDPFIPSTQNNGSTSINPSLATQNLAALQPAIQKAFETSPRSAFLSVFTKGGNKCFIFLKNGENGSLTLQEVTKDGSIPIGNPQVEEVPNVIFSEQPENQYKISFTDSNNTAHSLSIKPQEIMLDGEVVNTRGNLFAPPNYLDPLKAEQLLNEDSGAGKKFRENLNKMKELLTSKDQKITQERIKLIQNGISYDQAVLIHLLTAKLNQVTRVPNGFWNNQESAKNMIFVTLDTIAGFKEAREKNDIKTMAELVRKHVINYEPKDNKKFKSIGTVSFFCEAGGLRGLLFNNATKKYLGTQGSPASLVRFAIPDLIDPTNSDAVHPLEIERNYWTNPENAKQHIIKALDVIPGFKEARGKNDIKTMAELIRKHVINYEPKDNKKYKFKGSLSFFCEVGGLTNLLFNNSAQKYLDKEGSPAALIRFAVPGLIDPINPDAIKPQEIEYRNWSDPEDVKIAIVKALDTIPGFKEAREKNDIKTMALLYKMYVTTYQPESESKYTYNGATAFFKQVGGLAGLMNTKNNLLDKTGSPDSLIKFALPRLYYELRGNQIKDLDEKSTRGKDAISISDLVDLMNWHFKEDSNYNKAKKLFLEQYQAHINDYRSKQKDLFDRQNEIFDLIHAHLISTISPYNQAFDEDTVIIGSNKIKIQDSSKAISSEINKLYIDVFGLIGTLHLGRSDDADNGLPKGEIDYAKLRLEFIRNIPPNPFNFKDFPVMEIPPRMWKDKSHLLSMFLKNNLGAKANSPEIQKELQDLKKLETQLLGLVTSPTAKTGAFREGLHHLTEEEIETNPSAKAYKEKLKEYELVFDRIIKEIPSLNLDIKDIDTIIRLNLPNYHLSERPFIRQVNRPKIGSAIIDPATKQKIFIGSRGFESFNNTIDGLEQVESELNNFINQSKSVVVSGEEYFKTKASNDEKLLWEKYQNLKNKYTKARKKYILELFKLANKELEIKVDFRDLFPFEEEYQQVQEEEDASQ